MRTPDDPDEFGKDLGKKVTPPPKEAGDEYEQVKTEHGWMLRNKRTGRIEQTSITPTGPRRPYVPPKPVEVVPATETSTPITTEQWDAMTVGKILQQQEEDGYPNIYWGTF